VVRIIFEDILRRSTAFLDTTMRSVVLNNPDVESLSNDTDGEAELPVDARKGLPSTIREPVRFICWTPLIPIWSAVEFADSPVLGWLMNVREGLLTSPFCRKRGADKSTPDVLNRAVSVDCGEMMTAPVTLAYSWEEDALEKAYTLL
jgi:hypothetical protein